METRDSLLEKALLLKPQERYLLIEGLIQSLDASSKQIDSIWVEEAAKRLAAHRRGKTKGIPVEHIFGEVV
jgi:putative addiction module component (TIGR02574 family)